MQNERYPIGPFSFTDELDLSDAARARRIETLETLPRRLRETLAGITVRELSLSYRPGGWTVRQVVHHIPDSHLNGYVRFKWALTEDAPLIKAYDQESWALLPDSQQPIEPSLDLLEALHRRWATLLRGMRPADFARIMRHPEHSVPISLDAALANYAWHGDHHMAHIRLARQV